MSSSRDSGDSKEFPPPLHSGSIELPADIVANLPIWLDYKDLAAWAQTNKSSQTFFQPALLRCKLATQLATLATKGEATELENELDKLFKENPALLKLILTDEITIKEVVKDGSDLFSLSSRGNLINFATHPHRGERYDSVLTVVKNFMEKCGIEIGESVPPPLEDDDPRCQRLIRSFNLTSS